MEEVREHNKFIIKVFLKHIRAMEKILTEIERKVREKIDNHYSIPNASFWFKGYF